MQYDRAANECSPSTTCRADCRSIRWGATAGLGGRRSRKDHRIRQTRQDSVARPGLGWTIRTVGPYRTGFPGLGWTHRTDSNQLKPPRGQPHAGSNPAPGTNAEQVKRSKSVPRVRPNVLGLITKRSRTFLVRHAYRPRNTIDDHEAQARAECLHPAVLGSPSTQSTWSGSVATLMIRGIDDELRDRLKVRAAQHDRSMEAEVREILAGALAGGSNDVGFGSRIHAPIGLA